MSRYVSARRSEPSSSVWKLSQNTAANHVRNILIKTGASNRTQAAIYAAERGLLQGR